LVFATPVGADSGGEGLGTSLALANRDARIIGAETMDMRIVLMIMRFMFLLLV
jgi:hypothetical protein